MDRLNEILESKEFQKIKPISDYQIEKAQRLSSRYILFNNKDAIHGTCECCLKDVTFESKTRHKSTVNCPSCKKKMTVEHIWRKRGCDYNVDWCVTGKAISKDIFVLRYIKGFQFRRYYKEMREVAREIFDFKTGRRFRIEYSSAYPDFTRKWREGNYYFTEHAPCSWYTRKNFCLSAYFLQTQKQIVNELSKIESIKYYDYESKIGTYYLLSDDIRGLLSAPLYEKMEKVGLNDIVERDFGYGKIKWNPKETSLVKMLKLDKRRYRSFLAHPSLNVLSFLQRYSRISEHDLAFLESNDFKDLYEYVSLRRLKVSKAVKAIGYIKKHQDNYWRFSNDYYHYLGTLKELGYDMNDETYIFPKDFKKADERIAKEKVEREKKKKEEEMRPINEKMSAICKGLREMPDLQEFLGGSKGLLVCVPESANDLYEEGKAQHNCVGSYAERIANGKTMVFFVRRLDKPNEPFITMEYCNGEVIQVRYDHNETVKDDNIISFVDAFAERLRKNNVMYKVA